MKFISFNINGLRARLHQLQAIIDKHQPDVIGLQEIKVHDDAFPLEQVQAMGYHVYHYGQKAHYGVALLSKEPATSVQYGFASDPEEAQRRMIIATLPCPDGSSITVLNGYFPQGDNINHPTKFPAKQAFYQDLQTHLETNEDPESQLIIMGDINISPLDLDIGIGAPNAKRWLKTGKCSFQPIEREWLARLQAWGLDDSYRQLHPDVSDQFSWFDYRSKGFVDNRGLRIDVILSTRILREKLTESGIDYELRAIEKPSDHAPVWSVYQFK